MALSEVTVRWMLWKNNRAARRWNAEDIYAKTSPPGGDCGRRVGLSVTWTGLHSLAASIDPRCGGVRSRAERSYNPVTDRLHSPSAAAHDPGRHGQSEGVRGTSVHCAISRASGRPCRCRLWEPGYRARPTASRNFFSQSASELLYPTCSHRKTPLVSKIQLRGMPTTGSTVFTSACAGITGKV